MGKGDNGVAAVAEAEPVGEAVLQTSVIPLVEILGPLEQPRAFFDMMELQDLAQDMAVNGQIQPIRVREFHPTDGSERVMYQILWGERRFRAAHLNKWTTIRAEVERADAPVLKPHELLFRQLSENAARSSLSPVEEGRAFKRLVKLGHEVVEIAGRVRQSQSHVYTRMKMAEVLSDAVIDALNHKRITAGHAECLCQLDHEQQGVALEEIVECDMSVRGLREFVAQCWRGKVAAPVESAASGGNGTDRTDGTDKEPVLPMDVSAAREQLNADATPVERKAELPSGPVAERAQINGAKLAEANRFEIGVRKRIIREIMLAADTNKEFIRQYVARVAGQFALDYLEEFKLLRELMGDAGFTSVEQMHRPFRALIGMELVGYCDAVTTSCQVERPKDLIELAKLAGVDIAKCEADEKSAVAGMVSPKKAKAAKAAAQTAKKTPGWLAAHRAKKGLKGPKGPKGPKKTKGKKK